MSHNLTESSTFTANVQTPDDGDFVNEASIEPALQALANRTKYLNDRHIAHPGTTTDGAIVLWDGTDGTEAKDSLAKVNVASGEYEYVTPKTRTRFVPLHHAQPSVGSAWTVSSTAAIASGNGATLEVELRELPVDCVITQIRVGINPGEARATSGNRMQFQLYRFIPDTATTFVIGQAAVGSAITDDGTTNAQIRTLSSISYTIVATEWPVLRVVAGNTAASFNDSLSYVEVTFTDPGPRNA